GMAQVVTIGTGTDTQMQPLANYFGYERTADLYLASEINESGDINALAWNVDAIGSTHPIKIFIATTNDVVLTESSYDDLVTSSTPTLVYDGTIDATSASGWLPFYLDTPFPYNGTDNLIVIVENNIGGSGSDDFNTTKVTYTSGHTNQHMFWRKDSTPPDATTSATLNGDRSNIQLDFSPSPPSCTGTPDAGVATLTPSSGGSGYNAMLEATGYSSGLLGLEYQWEYRFNADPWQDFGGPTTAYADAEVIINGAVGSILEVRLKVTCSDSGLFAYSTSATYEIVPSYCFPNHTSSLDYF